MRFTLLLVLAACVRGEPPPTEQVALPRAPEMAKPAPPRPVQRYAVVELDFRVTECSNLGGHHYTFRIDDGTARIAHGGGHGVWRDLGSGLEVKRDYYVAELIETPRVDEDHDCVPDSSRAGWCLDMLPRDYSAEVVRLIPAKDRADAHRMLADVQRDGMSAEAITWY